MSILEGIKSVFGPYLDESLILKRDWKDREDWKDIFENIKPAPMPGAIQYPDFFFTEDDEFIDPMGSSRIVGGTPGRAEEGYGRYTHRWRIFCRPNRGFS